MQALPDCSRTLLQGHVDQLLAITAQAARPPSMPRVPTAAVPQPCALTATERGRRTFEEVRARATEKAAAAHARLSSKYAAAAAGAQSAQAGGGSGATATAVYAGDDSAPPPGFASQEAAPAVAVAQKRTFAEAWHNAKERGAAAAMRKRLAGAGSEAAQHVSARCVLAPLPQQHAARGDSQASKPKPPCSTPSVSNPPAIVSALATRAPQPVVKSEPQPLPKTAAPKVVVSATAEAAAANLRLSMPPPASAAAAVPHAVPPPEALPSAAAGAFIGHVAACAGEGALADGGNVDEGEGDSDEEEADDPMDDAENVARAQTAASAGAAAKAAAADGMGLRTLSVSGGQSNRATGLTALVQLGPGEGLKELKKRLRRTFGKVRQPTGQRRGRCRRTLVLTSSCLSPFSGRPPPRSSIAIAWAHSPCSTRPAAWCVPRPQKPICKTARGSRSPTGIRWGIPRSFLRAAGRTRARTQGCAGMTSQRHSTTSQCHSTFGQPACCDALARSHSDGCFFRQN